MIKESKVTGITVRAVAIKVAGMPKVSVHLNLLINMLKEVEWERVHGKIDMLQKYSYLSRYEFAMEIGDEALVRNVRRCSPSMIIPNIREVMDASLRSQFTAGLSEADFTFFEEVYYREKKMSEI